MTNKWPLFAGHSQDVGVEKGKSQSSGADASKSRA
jgi:hypothetical protein